VRGAIRNVDLYFKRETLLRAPFLRLRMPVRRLYHRSRYELARDPLLRQEAVAHATDGRLVPLPFGIVDTGFEPPGKKEYDIAFLASPTSPEREALVSELASLQSEGLRVALRLEGGPRLAWRSYLDLIARSRIAISVRGAGFDTYRYWEIPYAGTALLSETPRIVIPANFIDGEEAMFAPLGSLASAARELLARGDDERLAAAGRQAVLGRHASVDRAARVLERLDSLRPGRA
jgi:Glycosyl transferases group 1